MKKVLCLLFFVPVFAFAESMYSPTWGFFMDPPETYEFVEGDGRDRFSFKGPSELMFDVLVYDGVFANIEAMVTEVNRRLGNRGEFDFFTYRDKQAVIIELVFGDSTGWGIGVELSANAAGVRPLLVALSYGPADGADLDLFHFSALDSISPSLAELFYPGLIMEYGYPRGEPEQVTLAEGSVKAMIYGNDAVASQVLIEREYNVLVNYVNTPFWREAWIRYYRFVFRDSYDRVADAASVLAQHMGGNNLATDAEKKEFAQRALSFVQNFHYEREPSGSDFLNLVSAVVDGRGDCDSRAMLWAIILSRANIRSAMMVSRQYGHAMGLAEIAGEGARFESHGVRWLVAETTDRVNIGLIAQDVSDPAHWIGIIFE